MGKSRGNKPKSTLKGSGSIPLFFASADCPSPPASEPSEKPKMAPDSQAEAPISKQDLIDLGSDLKAHFTDLMSKQLVPIFQKVSEFNSAIKDVSHTAWVLPSRVRLNISSTRSEFCWIGLMLTCKPLT